MRLLLWGLFFLSVLFGSAWGVTVSSGNPALAAVFALLFPVGLVGLALTGLAYLLRSGYQEPYGHPAVTLRGEVVRSNSERVIADYFSGSGIRYAYEHPVTDQWGLRMISRPDFYLPDYDVYVEYWGLAGLPDGIARQRYERSMQWKMEQYRRNEIRLVSLHPNELNSLDAAFRSKLEQASGRTLHPTSAKLFSILSG